MVAANGIGDGYVRPLAWRGAEMMGVSAQHCRIHVAIAAWTWPAYFTPEARLRGIRMTRARYARPAPNTAPTESKAAGLYMICTLSKHEAEAKGYDDALMLDYRGFLAEGTGANLFLVIDGKLHTPMPDCFLNGITRQTVIELAHGRGIEVVERHIAPEELADAQEVFLTGTAVEVTPVREIDEHQLPGRRDHPPADRRLRRADPRAGAAPGGLSREPAPGAAACRSAGCPGRRRHLEHLTGIDQVRIADLRLVGVVDVDVLEAGAEQAPRDPPQRVAGLHDHVVDLAPRRPPAAG